MVLTTKDKNFLLKSMNHTKKMVKIFGKRLSEDEVTFLMGIEPAIKKDTLTPEQIQFLIKNMESVYLSTRVKYVKKLISNLENMLETESEIVVN